MLHNLFFFSLQNAIYFIMLTFFGSCIIHILNTGVLKFKRKFRHKRVNKLHFVRFPTSIPPSAKVLNRFQVTECKCFAILPVMLFQLEGHTCRCGVHGQRAPYLTACSMFRAQRSYINRCGSNIPKGRSLTILWTSRPYRHQSYCVLEVFPTSYQ